jgi:HrpA-like RNA helicase
MAERQRAQLPIFASPDKFHKRLQREKVLVVVGETGSGKSTQVPQYAAECFPDDLVVCTQPREIASMVLAGRVADEYDGTSEGNSVGYQVGNNSNRKNDCVPGTNIMFMTDVALIYEFQMDSSLRRIGVLIIEWKCK